MEPPRQKVFAFSLLAMLFLILTLPAILSGRGGSIMAYDLTDFHWQEIQRIGKTFPTFRLDESFSATAPGLHWFLAGIQGVSHCSFTQLRMVASLFGLLAFLISWQVTQCWVKPLWGVLCVAPLMLSNYVLGSAIWMTTDTPGFALGVLALAMAFGWTPWLRTSFMGGLFTAAAVCVRQSSLWCAVPGVVEHLRHWSRSHWRHPEQFLARIGLWIVPPIATLAFFVSAWGGLVPQRFQTFHASSLNVTAPAVTLALLGLWGCVLLPGVFASLSQRQRSAAIVAGALACAFACAVPTTQHIVRRPDSQVVGTPSQGRSPEFDADPASITTSGVGRWGGPIWTIASRTPLTSQVSWGVVACAGLGGAVIAGLFMRAAATSQAQAAWIVGSFLAAMTLSQMANSQNFQRYFDPWILLSLGWIAAAGSRDGERGGEWLGAGLALMAVIQMAISCWQVYVPAFTGPPLNL